MVEMDQIPAEQSGEKARTSLDRLALAEIAGSVACIGTGYVVDRLWPAIPATILYISAVIKMTKYNQSE